MKLLVLVPRGLRADMLGPYGNRWIDTPNLDILAASGTVFDWHFSVHPAEAHAVWRSGQYRFHPGAAGDIFRTLAASGVTTRLVRDTSRGVAAGFAEGWGKAHECAGMEATLSKAKGQLKALLPEDGWLLWAEFASLLPPWRIAPQFLDAVFEPRPEEDDDGDPEEMAGLELLPEEEQRLEPLLDPKVGAVDATDDHLFLRVQSTMAGAVAQMDAVFGELLDGLPDDVTLLVMSDEGLALGEHGWLGLGDSRLFDAHTHVPLIVLGPGWVPGWRTSALTASVDIAPTLAAMFGVEFDGAHGKSLLPLGEMDAAWARQHVCLGSEAERALRSAEWLLRKPYGGLAALFEKPADRYDVADLSGPRFAEAERLESELESAVASLR